MVYAIGEKAPGGSMKIQEMKELAAKQGWQYVGRVKQHWLFFESIVPREQAVIPESLHQMTTCKFGWEQPK